MPFARSMIIGSLLTSLAWSASSDAQVVQGGLSVGAGVATDQRGVRSNALTVAPSVVLAPDPRVSASIGLSATQFQSNVRALGGTGSLGTRLSLGSVFALTGSAAASGTRTSFNATYASAELTPTLEATLSGVTLFAGAHVAGGRTTLREASSIPGAPLGSPNVSARDVTTSRTSAGPVFGGVLNVAGLRADQAATLTYREEQARVGPIGVADRVLSAAMVNGSLALSASAGMRDASDEHVGFGSASATLSVGRAIALQASVGSYPSNRLTGTLGGRFASVGVVLHGIRRLDGARDESARVRGAPAVPADATRLAIAAPRAKRVELSGDWNGWAPLLATRAPDGTWYADVRLPRGEYRYAFKIDGDRWNVPDGAPAVDDGFGGRSALLTVR